MQYGTPAQEHKPDRWTKRLSPYGKPVAIKTNHPSGKPFVVTPQQHSVLTDIAMHPDSGVRERASRLGRNPGAIAKAIKVFSRAGILVEPKTGQRRGRYASVSWKVADGVVVQP